jgi:hypothetical protein
MMMNVFTYLFVALMSLSLIEGCQRGVSLSSSTSKTADTVVDGVAYPKTWNEYERSFNVATMQDYEVLSMLFESDSFVDSTREIVWRPDTEERTKFNVSGDGNVYTAVDTILYWDNYALLIMKTKEVSIDRGVRTGYESCCACCVNYSAALFEKTNIGWKLNVFQKNFFDGGENGEDSSTFRIADFYKDSSGYTKKCLIYRDQWIRGGHMGYWSGTERYFAIATGREWYRISDRISPLLTVTYGVEDATGYVDHYIRTCDARFIKKSGFHDIMVHVTTSRISGNTKSTELYQYDEESERYIKK